MRSDVALKNELVNFLEMAIANDGELGLSAQAIQDLTDAIELFNAGMDEVTNHKALLKSWVTSKNEAATAIREIVGSYAQQWRANPNIQNKTLDQLNVPPHATKGTQSPATPPSDLNFTLTSPTTIALKWNRGSNTAGTVFNLQQASSNMGPWTIVKTTTATKATMQGVPGSPTYFRVYAVRGQSVSTPSSIATVWPGDSEEIFLSEAA